MNVAALVGICVAFVIGSNLVTPVATAVAGVNQTLVGTSVYNMLSLLTLVMVAILIIGGVSYISYGR